MDLNVSTNKVISHHDVIRVSEMYAHDDKSADDHEESGWNYIHGDVFRYAHDDKSADDHEESGWNYIHGDVFRFPKNKSLFATALGCGTQLFTLTFFIFIVALVGVFYPYNRRVLFIALVGLTKLLADNAPKAMKEQKLESYFGRKIAIDASMSIYQFLIVVGRVGSETLTNEAGEVTSYVFDGQPPDLKKQELAKRNSKRLDATEDLQEARESGNQEDIEKFSKRTVKVTRQHNEDCKQLLRLMGVPVIDAPSEAEAQCAALCNSGKASVYAVASEDMDSLTFGTPKFLRHLMDPSSRKVPVMEFDVAKVLEGLNLTMDQFIDLCILSGCDYCDNIRGIGGQTALKLIRQHGSIEQILQSINRERYSIPDDWPYEEARRLFKEPLVCMDDEQLDLKWSAPDTEGLITFLVNENGFNIDRGIEKIKAAKNKSSQGRLESFFNPVANTSAPIKRKEPEKTAKETTSRKLKAGGGRKEIVELTFFSSFFSSTSVIVYRPSSSSMHVVFSTVGMYTLWAYSFAQVIVEIPYMLTSALLYVIITYPMIGYYWSANKVLWSFYTIWCSELCFTHLGMITVSVTPNVQVAFILGSFATSTMNLFSGYYLPVPKMPSWWVWLCYFSPTSWLLNAIFVSQYEDIDKEIQAFGETMTVSAFIEDYFGYHHKYLGPLAFVLIIFPVALASLFTFFTGKLNFQRR
ncbi:Flap endonuclease 1 [Hibiscus syriacus]|uniref:Flap endonuclease 1 n=1 Tax=Hibiscus syriacus TaxID=106335 RepID=A0A6A2Y587_HIBSY|nr:Flap endonuclease 1 [Hibiscus syriacus]